MTSMPLSRLALQAAGIGTLFQITHLRPEHQVPLRAVPFSIVCGALLSLTDRTGAVRLLSRPWTDLQQGSSGTT